jgi:hypothetical protein
MVVVVVGEGTRQLSVGEAAIAIGGGVEALSLSD